jgi:hypothetical protein
LQSQQLPFTSAMVVRERLLLPHRVEIAHGAARAFIRTIASCWKSSGACILRGRIDSDRHRDHDTSIANTSHRLDLDERELPAPKTSPQIILLTVREPEQSYPSNILATAQLVSFENESFEHLPRMDLTGVGCLLSRG